MFELLLEAMPRPHVAKQDITELSRLVVIEPVHRPPLAVEGAEGAPGGLRPGLRPQSFELFGREPAIPNRVLQSLMPHEGGACLQGRPANKIEPAGVTQHGGCGFSAASSGGSCRL